jgi:hypothetical protein
MSEPREEDEIEMTDNEVGEYDQDITSPFSVNDIKDPPIRTLMGPGPSDVHPRILSAMARPTIGHLDPAFVGMMNETKEGLKTIFIQRNRRTPIIFYHNSHTTKTGDVLLHAHTKHTINTNHNLIAWFN